MSEAAHVAKVYRIEYGLELDSTEFRQDIRVLNEKDRWLVVYQNDEMDSMELSKESLEKLSSDKEIPEHLRTLCQKLLENGDPDNDYVRVDFF